ncbi:hypothetical protein B9Z19DRAFT_1140514 [Tuber borchii]|uniref:Autophagy-related protein 1 n=1 Tax=Tuber borchii TaxID=42251 RepID=A0A2T6ZU64_TUBBO|nr:hypothetical protein B9Z19DRAFT_1140514 [Tuber borchii]
MEYLEEGDLTKHIGAPLLQETVRNISKQILEGLKVMHQQGIAHRDLKPANIFVVSVSRVGETRRFRGLKAHPGPINHDPSHPSVNSIV